MVNVKIYQAYFDVEQIPHLDPEFTPLDNSQNPYPELREYPLFLKCRDRAKLDNADIWGYLSWKWRQKMPNLSARDILQRIDSNPGYDVYFFNFAKTTNYYNVWEHGNMCHPHIITIMEKVFPLMGVDPAVLYQPMSNDVSFFALYCAGNSKWWDGLISFTTKFLNSIELLDEDTKRLFNSSALYHDASLNYFPFIHERLLSTYLFLNRNILKILPYHYEQNTPAEEMLEHIKIATLEKNERQLADAWFRLRNSYSSHTTNWADKLNIS